METGCKNLEFLGAKATRSIFVAKYFLIRSRISKQP